MKRILAITLLLLAFISISFLLWKPKLQKLSFKKADFSRLPGWGTTNIQKSLLAFQLSCKTFLKQNPNKSVGSDYVPLKAKDWYPACQAALALKPGVHHSDIQGFFQQWFTPVEFYKQEPVKGLFTGYYMPLLHGSLTKTTTYHVPLYAVPKNLVSVHLEDFDKKLKPHSFAARVHKKRVIPYFTREQINNGAISKIAKVIAWIDSPIERSFLEIQGSGIVELQDGRQLPINYAGENGAPYTAIAKILINKGVMTRDNASMKHIRRYLESHPTLINSILNKNKSFVFFDVIKHGSALGSQGIALTPGYSLAIDLKWIPLGAPVWLNTTSPGDKTNSQNIFQRLMVAQDTGGAIKGAVRGDIYWGAGDKAAKMAGRMKNNGHYWLLLPKHVLSRMQEKII